MKKMSRRERRRKVRSIIHDLVRLYPPRQVKLQCGIVYIYSKNTLRKMRDIVEKELSYKKYPSIMLDIDILARELDCRFVGVVYGGRYYRIRLIMLSSSRECIEEYYRLVEEDGRTWLKIIDVENDHPVEHKVFRKIKTE